MSNIEPAEYALEALAGGLAGRLRALAAALDRLDRLESGSGAWLASFAGTELNAAVTELVLRALRTAADPMNFSLLQLLAAAGSCSLGQLIERSGLGRLVLAERLNDLVQIGMALHLIDTDQAQITAAGAASSRLIAALGTLTSQAYLAGSGGE